MSQPIQLGMHGFGYIGRVHRIALETAAMTPGLCPDIVWKECIVRNLASDSGALARRVFHRVTDAVVNSDLHDLDVIDIVSPNDAHRDVVMRAVSAGLPIYCEKPLSNGIEDAQTMTKAVTNARLLNQVALINRFHPGVEHAYAILRSGALGEVLTFSASLLHGGYLDAKRKMSWRLQNRNSGGGAIVDLGVHMIDLVHMLLGGIASVNAKMKTFISERLNTAGAVEHVHVDDWAHLQVQLKTGPVGTIEVSRVHHGLERNEMRIVCRRGTIHIDLDTYQLAKVTTVSGADFPEAFEAPLAAFRLPPKFRSDMLLTSHATALLCFLHRLGNGKAAVIEYPVPTFTDALHSEQVVFAAQRSADVNHEVEVMVSSQR